MPDTKHLPHAPPVPQYLFLVRTEIRHPYSETEVELYGLFSTAEIAESKLFEIFERDACVPDMMLEEAVKTRDQNGLLKVE